MSRSRLILLIGAVSFVLLTLIVGQNFIDRGFQPSPIIEIFAQGFSPNFVSIKAGTTITFKNLDRQPHWPASNIHPTHEIYPEFDPTQPIEANKSWSFNFTKEGEWRYHDHLHPEITGTIQVQNSQRRTQKEPTLTEKYATLSSQIESRQKFYASRPADLTKDLSRLNLRFIISSEPDLYYWLSLADGQRLLKELVAQTGGGSLIDCHQEAHRLGRMAFFVYGAEVFKEGNSDCHSGYYHGAMEAFLTKNGSENLAAKIDNLCQRFVTRFTLFECLHGVGHGLLAYLDYNLPAGLNLCRTLNTKFAQSSCFGGLFMENIVTAEGLGAGKSHQTQWVSPDPLFPCSVVENSTEVQEQCYLMQTSRMLDLNNHDFDRVIPLCLRAPTNLISTCYQSLGRDAAGQSLRDGVKINLICQKIPQDQQRNCLRGGLYVIVEFWGENLNGQARNFCQILGGDQRNYCFQLLGGRLREIFPNDPEKIKANCPAQKSAFQKICLAPESEI